MLSKKWILAIPYLLLTTSGFCSAFYIGGGVGPESADFEQNAHLVEGVVTDVTDKTDLSGWGLFGTLFGGYEFKHQRFYLAGELNAKQVEFGLIYHF